MAATLKANPTMRGVVFDLLYILDDARALAEAEGVAARCDIVAGNFFASVPTGGHAYILRSAIVEEREQCGLQAQAKTGPDVDASPGPCLTAETTPDVERSA
jgi:O-methyltransferase domain